MTYFIWCKRSSLCNRQSDGWSKSCSLLLANWINTLLQNYRRVFLDCNKLFIVRELLHKLSPSVRALPIVASGEWGTTCVVHKKELPAEDQPANSSCATIILFNEDNYISLFYDTTVYCFVSNAFVSYSWLIDYFYYCYKIGAAWLQFRYYLYSYARRTATKRIRSRNENQHSSSDTDGHHYHEILIEGLWWREMLRLVAATSDFLVCHVSREHILFMIVSSWYLYVWLLKIDFLLKDKKYVEHLTWWESLEIR